MGMMARRAVGSNQYRTRTAPDLPSDAGPNLMQQAQHSDAPRKCGEVWGGRCQQWVYPPTYSHSPHGLSGLANKMEKAAQDPSCSPLGLRLLVDYADSRTEHHFRYLAVVAARNPNCPPEMLWRLSNHTLQPARHAVASSDNAPVDLVTHMLNDADGGVRRMALRNPNCPPEKLRQAAISSDPAQRWTVACNPNCPPDLLDRLTQDTDMAVIQAAYAHPHCSPKMMRRFVHLDQNVAQAAALGLSRHPDCPADLLPAVARKGGSRALDRLISRPDLPIEVLHLAAGCPKKSVLIKLAKRHDCPVDALQRMISHISPEVRRAALESPQCPEEYRALARVAR